MVALNNSGGIAPVSRLKSIYKNFNTVKFPNLVGIGPDGVRAGAYNQLHRDPFDRMLAAQAELERLVLLTADPQLSTFPCRTLW